MATESSINFIAKEIAGTTKEKIVHACLKEFIASNSLRIIYNMSKEDFENAYEEFKKLVENLPETLLFVEFK
jgi:hypothetical protein